MTDREIVDQWLVVELSRKEVADFSGDAQLDADCAVGFVYVDSMCGMTLNVDAWCMAEGGSLRPISRPWDEKHRVMLRYDCFAGKRNRLLTPPERDTLGMPSLPDWLQHYYAGEETTRALRALPLLDPVRAPGFPDDIKCLLYDTAVKEGECIWAKLVRREADDLFVCRLLNEPFQDFGLHQGGLIRVAVKAHEDGLICVCIGKATANGT